MASILEKVDPDLKVPFDREALLSGDPKQLTDYMRKLVKVLQELLEKVITAANFGIDLNDGEALYIGTKNEDGDYPNGTWRLIKSGDNLQRQCKISGTWTVAGDWERPV